MISRGKQLVRLSIARTAGSESKGDEHGYVKSQCVGAKKEHSKTDENDNLINRCKESDTDDDSDADPEWLPKKKRKSETLTSFLECHETLPSENSGTDDDMIPQKTRNPNDVIIDPVYEETIKIANEADETQEAVSNILNEPEIASTEDTGEVIKVNSTSDITFTAEKIAFPAEEPVVDHEEVVEKSHLAQKIKDSTKAKSVKNKRLRMAGQKYMGLVKDESGKKAYTVEKSERLLTQSKCSKRCKTQKEGRKCSMVNEVSRQEIFSSFWYKMNWDQKKVYVLGLIERKEVKRRTCGGQGCRRNCTLTYHLRIGDKRIPVCKEMFLSTLGLHEKMVYKWVEAAGSRVPHSSSVRKEYQIDTSEPSPAMEYAREYLDALPKVPSHYCRVSTGKEYIEPLFATMVELHEEYKVKLESESKPVLQMTQFRKLFRSMNLSLFHPKKDLCDTCCGYEAGTTDETEYQAHIKRKDDARAAKAIDKEKALNEENIKVLTVDLQSLLLCPKLNASCLYYKTKLSCHNYTVYDLASRSVKCYFWHEIDGELTSNVFASCLIDYLESENLQGIENIIIYSDGCGYQNRNAVLSNAILQFSMKHKITIEQKYLERGHTQMECDSAHSVIERKVKNKPIYVPQQYVEIMKNARKDHPYEVKYLRHNFFKDYSKCGKYKSIRPGTGVGTATVNDIRQLKYTCDGIIHYKTDYQSEQYAPMPEPRKVTLNLNQEPSDLYGNPLPLKRSKFDHLQQLKQVIPRDFHAFYDALPHL